jgi:uncharacterized protein involved in outer membrane biogenesis
MEVDNRRYYFRICLRIVENKKTQMRDIPEMFQMPVLEFTAVAKYLLWTVKIKVNILNNIFNTSILTVSALFYPVASVGVIRPFQLLNKSIFRRVCKTEKIEY